MFRKLLSKIMPKAIADLADRAVVRELDKRTGGAVSKAEDVVEGIKGRRQ